MIARGNEGKRERGKKEFDEKFKQAPLTPGKNQDQCMTASHGKHVHTRIQTVYLLEGEC